MLFSKRKIIKIRHHVHSILFFHLEKDRLLVDISRHDTRKASYRHIAYTARLTREDQLASHATGTV
jgi:hypothetical protein